MKAEVYGVSVSARQRFFHRLNRVSAYPPAYFIDSTDLLKGFFYCFLFSKAINKCLEYAYQLLYNLSISFRRILVAR